MKKKHSSTVGEYIETLSIESKVAQLQGIWIRELLNEQGDFSVEKCRERIPFGIGHVSQFACSVDFGPEKLRQTVKGLQDYLLHETESGIPAIIHDESITGMAARGATTLPQVIGMACSWNPEQVKKNTAATARLMRKLGMTQALSPVLDVCNNAHWGRIEESYGEEEYLTAAMGLAFVEGLQGDDLKTGVAATTKHFAGYGGINDDLHAFYEETLLPHEVAIRLGKAESTMPGYHPFHGLPCSASPKLLTEILREEWGFNGVVVSDYYAVKQAHSAYGIGDSYTGSGIACLEAGIDVELPTGECFPGLVEKIQSGDVDVELINTALTRLLTQKEKLGLLDRGAIYHDGPFDFDPPENRELAYTSACQSIVLLKNEGILPLAPATRSIAIVGPNADAIQSLTGDYTYQSMSGYWWRIPPDPETPKLVTLLQGLKNRAGDRMEIQYERGCDWIEQEYTTPMIEDIFVGDERIRDIVVTPFTELPTPNPERAIELANQSDVVIAAMGENLYLCGEGRDRDDARLPGEQEAFVKKLCATGKPVILVVFGGRPPMLTELEPHCAAIVQAWYPGEEGGHAVADLLLGQVNPSAKLTVTLPRDNTQCPIQYCKGYDPENPPLYPFGHGLSYTTFAYTNAQIPSAVQTTDEWIDLAFDLTNTGTIDGTEIAQIYLHATGLSMPRPDLKLKGFKRIALRAGETKTIRARLAIDQLAFYNADLKQVIEPGTYEIRIGASSIDTPLVGNVQLTGPTQPRSQREHFFCTFE